MKKYIDDIKPYMSMILLIPAILGGIWQLFELSKMSISYIRFFSATQLLPDGLIILILLFTIYLGNKIGSAYMDDLINNYKEMINTEKIIFTKIKPVNFNLYSIKKIKSHFFTNKSASYILKDKSSYINDIYLAIIPICMGFFALYSNIKLDLLTLLSAYFFIVFFGKSAYLNIQTLYFLQYKKELSISSLMNKHILTKRGIIMFFIISSLIVVFVVESIALFHNKLFMPNNLINLKNIQTILSNSEYNSSKILYMNDKYIFVEHLKNEKVPSKSVIHIIKFENLFLKK